MIERERRVAHTAAGRGSSRARRPGRAAPPQGRLRRRRVLDANIVAAAEELFAQHGFQGVSIAEVAARVGISKQNLTYYFPTKEALYRRVLDGVLDEWLERLRGLADPDKEPEAALRDYIRAKLRYSRERPSGSRVFATEIIAGLPLYAREIRARVVPALRAQVETLGRWVADGRVEPIDPVHLMFVLWAATQTYADFSHQMALVMDKEALEPADFDAAEEVVTRVVLRALGLAAPAPSPAQPR
ncbi:TetR/AcrR family transcriptional regulator [Anaeromyxobacter oryzae]|uniref:TetR family transcriptional regulator n=1 Tax=Anaeromyxobacter oryzae TaxID=2918170 RepID=A0ABM7WSM2_9BACT|nr:TetR/AcrR family transcriptional regulator [Anaeromyxobacter oryzae]BDG02481.1 TetR family transcriptional regulator [Anaeromyxobacter oryzae]